ncbi:MAG: DUF4127 family protein [Candidatus Gastranaerophilales bacterium]|nr:DUF4127 family protein [Candidatus Gastranaerophilales bacterium]
MKRIALVPIDNRPVCYDLPLQISAINPDIELILPDKKFLGGLTSSANAFAILDWLEKTQNIDAIILSLDTIAYGGLVPSRRSSDSFEAIKCRIELLYKILKNRNCKIYAFSSIMRISNNNFNEEEKDYWASFGKDIFEYSFNLHKMEVTHDKYLNQKCNCISTKIPQDILDDYLMTRNRNFKINKLYLEYAQTGLFDTLVFSKDDCAEFGLNVKEANILKQNILDKKINAFVKTGADEIPLALLSRAISNGKIIKIAPSFLMPISIGKISKYEDISVIESVKSQIELAGGTYSTPNSADLILYVNNFKNEQGELVMDTYEPLNNRGFKPASSKYFVADILNANGADNSFVDSLLENDIDCNNFYGFAAWNTTGNTLGSAICAAITKFTTQNPNLDAFKKLQTIRFLDDWAYQANLRKKIKDKFNTIEKDYIARKMQKYEAKLEKKFGKVANSYQYSFPWNRTFEIEIILT